MITALMGLPGKVKTLLDRLTSTRAGYLDNLSAGAVAPASTALSTSTWTGTKAGYLDVAISTRADDTKALLAIPIASGLVGSSTKIGTADWAGYLVGMTTENETSSSYVAKVNYTGSGVLNFLGAQILGTSGTPEAWIKLTIDGAVIFTDLLAGSSQYSYVVAVGAVSVDGSGNPNGVALDQIPFKSSLKIEAKAGGGGGNYAKVAYKYRKTS